jgi:G3E family GTPase
MDVLQNYLAPKDKVCSIVLVCGYLGAGKTTLIQYILKKQLKFKVAVIQNEFSDDGN